MSDRKKTAIISLFVDDVQGIPPLGPLYVATALKKHGHDVLIIHENADQGLEKVIQAVFDYKPDLVGMSVFTGYNNGNYIKLSRLFKEKGYKIVWGNAHPSLLPEQVLSEPAIDFVVIGEGEETLLELVNNLDQPESYSAILGLGYKNERNEIIINDKRPFINLDDYLIDWSLIDLERYLIPYFSNTSSRTIAITTSRGCPFNCQFCYNQVFNERRWRAHSAAKIIENIKPLIEKYKIDGIRFDDDNFFVNKERAFMITEALGLPYNAEARVEYVNEDFINKLKETNCREVTFGFESGSRRIIDNVVRKGSSLDDIIKAVTLFKKSGILVSGSFVFGFPSETKEEYFETMKFIMQLLEINGNLGFTCGWYLPFPGTPLFYEAIKDGFKPPLKTEDWDKFNRWRRDYEMSWVKWDYKLAVKYSRLIINLLAMAYKRNIGILKRLLRWRINHFNFSFPIDIYIFSRIRNIYMFGDNQGKLIRLMQKLMIFMIKIKQKKSQNRIMKVKIRQ
jgi:anaerobic magnesium-protoporphyrin IX monomethyl ester cyclase